MEATWYFYMILFIFTVVFFIAAQVFILISTYGRFISKKDAEEFMYLDENKLSKNPFNSYMLKTGKTFISNVPFNFFSKYYIDGVGVILRWSKLHKKVEEYYEMISHK